MQMHKYEYKDKYEIIPLKTVSGDYAPAQALSMKTKRHRPRGRVVDQPDDDECRKRSTSRLHRLAAKRFSPPSSGSVEQRKRLR